MTRRLPAVLLLTLVLLVLFHDDLSPGRYLVTYRADRFEPWGPESDRASFNPDCLQSYYPRRVYLRDALAEGRIPLWDPYSFCGQPFLANFQSGVLNPINLAIMPFSAERQMGIYVWIHLWVAGAGMLLFLRTIGVGRTASLVGALMFAANGALAARTGQSTILATAAWYPLLLALVERAATGRGGVAALAGGYALAVLSGFPPNLAWGTILILIYGLYRSAPGWRRGHRRPALVIGGGLLLGLAVTAAQLLPTAEFLRQSDRIRFDYATLVSSAWHPAAILRFLLPDFLGTPFTGDDWVRFLTRGNAHYFQSYISTAAYIGVGALVPFAVGVAAAREDRRVRFFLIAGGVALLVLLGTPLLHVVSLVPGLGGARVDRVAHVLTLAVAVVASLGLDRLLREGKGVKVAIGAFAATLAGIAVLAFFGKQIAGSLGGPGALELFDDGRNTARALRSALYLTSVFAALLLARRASWAVVVAGVLLVLDPGLAARRDHVTVAAEELPRETPGIAFLRDHAEEGRIVRFQDNALPPNLPGLFGVEDVAGYNALTVKHYRRYFADIAGGATVKERRINAVQALATVRSPFLDRLAARWVIVGKSKEDPELPLVYDGEIRIHENEAAYPRAWLTYQVATPPGPRKASQLLSHPTTPRWTATVQKEEVLLDPDRKDLRTVGDWVGDGGGNETAFAEEMALRDTAEIVSREPEEVVVDCASRGGRLLVLSDTWYPGWKAFVDGEERRILRANRVLRGVVLPAGVHRVVFRYEPLTFKIGTVVSLVSLALLGFLASPLAAAHRPR